MSPSRYKNKYFFLVFCILSLVCGNYNRMDFFITMERSCSCEHPCPIIIVVLIIHSSKFNINYHFKRVLFSKCKRLLADLFLCYRFLIIRMFKYS